MLIKFIIKISIKIATIHKCIIFFVFKSFNINFLPLITNKRVILVRLDLEYEGEMAILSGKELIYKYHIPYIFIEFNMLMFALHETRPQDFLRFFTENGYKISLKGFLTEEFISVEDIMRTNFITINLYLVFVGK